MSASDGVVSLILVLSLGLLAGLVFIGLMRPLRRNLAYRRLRRRVKRKAMRVVLLEPYPLPQPAAPAPGERPSSP